MLFRLINEIRHSSWKTDIQRICRAMDILEQRTKNCYFAKI